MVKQQTKRRELNWIRYCHRYHVCVEDGGSFFFHSLSLRKDYLQCGESLQSVCAVFVFPYSSQPFLLCLLPGQFRIPFLFLGCCNIFFLGHIRRDSVILFALRPPAHPSYVYEYAPEI